MQHRGRKKDKPTPDVLNAKQGQEEETGILCMRVDRMPAMIDSVKRSYACCQAPVCLSHGTDASIAKYPNRKLICLTCAPQHLQRDAALDPPTPAQLAELRDYFRRQEAERN